MDLRAAIFPASLLIGFVLGAQTALSAGEPGASAGQVRRLLYCGVPDPSSNSVPSKDFAILVYDLDDGLRLVKTVLMPAVSPRAVKPGRHGVRGLVAHAATRRLFVSHCDDTITCLDLVTLAPVWEQTYDGCDRPDVTPDGRKLYVPTGWWRGRPNWKAIDAANGTVLATIPIASGGAHNTLCSEDGRLVFAAATGNPHLHVIDTATDTIVRKLGPFRGGLWPFTVDMARGRAYVNVGNQVGFDIGDIATGKVIATIDVAGKESDKRRVHGIGLTPDGRELWLTDSTAGKPMIHIFDLTGDLPREIATHTPRTKSHGWPHFSRDGKTMFNDTGELVDVATRQTVGQLKAADGSVIGSSKTVEVQFTGDVPVWSGRQLAAHDPLPTQVKAP